MLFSRSSDIHWGFARIRLTKLNYWMGIVRMLEIREWPKFIAVRAMSELLEEMLTGCTLEASFPILSSIFHTETRKNHQLSGQQNFNVSVFVLT